MIKITREEFLLLPEAKQLEILYKWTKVKGNLCQFPGLLPSQHLPIFRDWCDKQESTGAYFCNLGFYFEDPEDAILFSLRWS